MSSDTRPVFPPEFQAALPDVFQAMDAGVIIVDRELRIRLWNGWMETTSGRPSGAVIGEPLTAVFPRLRPTVMEAFRAAIDGKPTLLSQSLHRYAIELPPPPGFEAFEQMQQSMRVAPIESHGDSISGAIAIIHDVTERVARERELRAATERAEDANRSKSDFLATMSHELRTPIGAMTGYADLILEGIYGPVNDSQRQHLQRIKAVGRHLLEIVEEILLFSRVEAGREETHLAEVDAFRVARDAISVVTPMARAKGLELSPSIPDTAVVCTTDEVKLRQILINLLGNAIKFTTRGEVRVTADTDDARELVLFTIRDTGTGIAPQNLGRIFEPFTQVESAYSRTQ